MVLCITILQIDNEEMLYIILSTSIASLSLINLFFSMYRIRKRLLKNGFDERIVDRINSKRYRLCLIGNICLLLLMLMYFMPIYGWLSVLLIVLVFFWCTTALTFASTQIWIFAFLSCHVATNNIRIIAWILFTIYGFVMIEVETRRISKCSKWKTLHYEDYWLRGCWCANCVLKACCCGIYESA